MNIFNNGFGNFNSANQKGYGNMGGENNSYTEANFKKPNNPFRNVTSKKFLLIIPVVFLVLYFIFLPPINLRSYEFWTFFFVIAVFSGLIIGPVFKITKNYFKTLLIIGIVVILLHLSSSEIFNAKRYAKILEVNEGSFAEEITEIPYQNIPTVDRDTAIRIGNREMGELYELVSQFNLDQSYTQINLNSTPVRVTPLEYNGLLKWLTNHFQGIPNYMLVNMIDGNAKLVPVENNIKYSHSDLLFRDIRRHVRFSYPTKIIEDISFEVDEEGRPFWVTPTYKPKISWFGAPDVNGIIITDASTGENNYYKLDEIPTWIDRAFEARNLNKQLEWYGKYQSGYFNSVLAQKGVLQPTTGYNYLAIGEDIYMYTGITSVAQDSSNIGFVLINLRTKETKLYRLSSADEVSAMESAEGEVQEKNYRSTFPILLNIDNKPTYFLSLKDNAGLIKMYAFIDAQNYQEVSTGNTVRAAYLRHMGQEITPEVENLTEKDMKSEKGTISDIYSVVIDGNTHYYFTIDTSDKIFVTSIKLSDNLPFLNIGDPISFDYVENNEINELVNIK